MLIRVAEYAAWIVDPARHFPEGLPTPACKSLEVCAQEGRVATLQSLSGTGSLRVAAEFISKFLPGTTAYLSNPTWGNHKVGCFWFRI